MLGTCHQHRIKIALDKAAKNTIDTQSKSETFFQGRRSSKPIQKHSKNVELASKLLPGPSNLTQRQRVKSHQRLHRPPFDPQKLRGHWLVSEALQGVVLPRIVLSIGNGGRPNGTPCEPRNSAQLLWSGQLRS